MSKEYKPYTGDVEVLVKMRLRVTTNNDGELALKCGKDGRPTKAQILALLEHDDYTEIIDEEHIEYVKVLEVGEAFDTTPSFEEDEEDDEDEEE